MRRNPYAATLERMAENTATAGIGIDLYPSGSQPWKGTSGILTTKAAAKHRKIQSWDACERGRPRSELITKVSGVPCSLEAIAPVAIAATSIKKEPTRV